MLTVARPDGAEPGPETGLPASGTDRSRYLVVLRDPRLAIGSTLVIAPLAVWLLAVVALSAGLQVIVGLVVGMVAGLLVGAGWVAVWLHRDGRDRTAAGRVGSPPAGYSLTEPLVGLPWNPDDPERAGPPGDPRPIRQRLAAVAAVPGGWFRPRRSHHHN